MDLNIWLAFFAASWVIAISPGSGAVLSMSHGLAYGVRHTSATIAGLQLGLSVILLIAGVGVGALLLNGVRRCMQPMLTNKPPMVWPACSPGCPRCASGC